MAGVAGGVRRRARSGVCGCCRARVWAGVREGAPAHEASRARDPRGCRRLSLLLGDSEGVSGERSYAPSSGVTGSLRLGSGVGRLGTVRVLGAEPVGFAEGWDLGC